MKNPLRLLAASILFAAISPASLLLAQSATPPSKPKPAVSSGTKTTHSSAAAAAVGPKLPANIPAVRGVPKNLVVIALKYIEIKPGTGELAKPGWKYSVHYTGWLYDGTKFDSSVDRGTPIDFVQGAHRVIPGWDQGFTGMHVGGKRRLFIPYQLAYGERGSGPIPAKSDLIFDIELVAQTDPNVTPPAPPATPAAPAASQPATPPAGAAATAPKQTSPQ
jgi:peptidylprolyl isomerase